MSTSTTVIFLLDILALKDLSNKNINSIKIKKVEELIKTLYSKINSTFQIDEEQYLKLSKIYKSKTSNELDKIQRNRMKHIARTLINYLETGEDSLEELSDEADKVISTLNKAYRFIIDSTKDGLKEILEEPLQENEVQKLKNDFSRNANIEIATLFISTGRSKEDFCNRTFISQSRLNRALKYILNLDDEKLEELKNKIIISEMELENEISLVEKVMMHYNRREKNISLIELQSLTRLSISGILKELKERNSPAHEKLKDMFFEYQNKLSLQQISFEEVRKTKTIINGREMTDEDHDIIENFIRDNKYPEQRAIYGCVKEAYFKGTLDLLKREHLKRCVLMKFNIIEKPKQKIYK